MTPTHQERIALNLAEIRQRMAAAAARSGRSAESVSLVAVTKYVELDKIRALVAAGVTLLGESRPQQLWQRAELLADLPVRWHLIGHLQRNKVRRTLDLVDMIHSVDTLELLQAANRIAEEMAAAATGTRPRVRVLLEVNTSGEAAKHGFDPQTLPAVIDQLPKMPQVEVRGLMCMAGLEGGPQRARGDFRALRELRDRLVAPLPDGVLLSELSMGMSGDYEVAIEEGATLVRIGSALFEGTDA